eukprot:SAG31_NODE_1009_length_10404_cov_27.639981_8_plen_155_part_00
MVSLQYVPGWSFQLQKGMNRLFASMLPETSWCAVRTASELVRHKGFCQRCRWRHNFNFTHKNAHTASLLHDNRWAHYAIPELVQTEVGAEDVQNASVSKAVTDAPESPRAVRSRRLADEGERFVENDLKLVAEYQTLRRLPRTRYILFTVRTCE